MRRVVLAVAELALLGGLLAACGGEHNSITAATLEQALETVPAAQAGTAVLGQAYHPDKKKIMNLSCVQGKTELRGNLNSSFTYAHDMNFNDALNTLVGGVGAGVRWPVVKVLSEAARATQHAATDLTETLHFIQIGTSEKEIFTAGTLVPSPLGLDYAQNRADLLEARCGKEFVSEVHRGALLLGTLKLEYFNAQDRLEAGGKINISPLGVIEADGSLQYVDAGVRKRTKISVTVSQLGGISERLLNWINFSAMACALDDPQPCLAAFQSLIGYAKNDFAEQLQDPTHYNEIRYVTQSYADSGIEALIPREGYSAVQLPVRLKLEETESRLRQALEDNHRASYLQTTGAPFLTSRQRDKVRAVAQKSNNNIPVLMSISSYCYEHLDDRCLTFALAREADLNPYDRDDLAIRPPVFGDLTDDGCVDEEDWEIFAPSFGNSVASGQADARADYNHDGWVDLADYDIIAAHWGQC